MARGAITIVGLGPGALDLASLVAREKVLDPGARLFLRTRQHPAADDIAAVRGFETCDDLYTAGATFEDVYTAVTERIVEATTGGDVVYAVPGSPLVGEFAVPKIQQRASELGIDASVLAGTSFIDVMCAEFGVDPIQAGLQILDGRDLPDPLILDKPTIIAQADVPVVLADIATRLSAVFPEDGVVHIVSDAGTPEVRRHTVHPDEIDPEWAGLRTSLFVDEAPGGIVGAIAVMRHLRSVCPWDQEQTHESLVPYLLEETFELSEALSLIPPDQTEAWGAYAAVEEELGDVLLQILFHTTIGEEAGTLSIDGVAETLRRKLVRRHAHVFGDADASDAEEVRTVWEQVKAEEKSTESALDGVPSGLPATERAMKLSKRAARLGFEWDSVASVNAKVAEELSELAKAESDDERVDEFGDVLLALINLARHLDISPEVALRRATDKFERRFRAVEAQGPITGQTAEELDRRWRIAKIETGQQH